MLRVTWGKSITLASVKRHFELLKANDHYSRALRVMTSSDVEELAFGLTEENMTLISTWRNEALSRYGSIRTGFFGLKPVPAAYISYFSSFFDAPNSTMRQFISEADAREWLLRDDLKKKVGTP